MPDEVALVYIKITFFSDFFERLNACRQLSVADVCHVWFSLINNAKIMQMSAMKDFLSNCRVQLIFCKDNANERNERFTFKLPSAAYLLQR